MTGVSAKLTVGGSMCLNDFNGKKGKIVMTLKGIDEIRSGLCKSDVFFNLLNCLDVEVDAADKATIGKKYQLSHQGVHYLKYAEVLRALRYDNHTERWTVATSSDDHAAALGYNRGKSVGSLHNVQANKLRRSYDPTSSRLNADDLQNAFGRQSGTDALNEAVAAMAVEDGEAVEIAPRGRTASQAGRSTKSKGSTFTETLAKQRDLFRSKDKAGSGLNKSMVSNAPPLLLKRNRILFPFRVCAMSKLQSHRDTVVS